MAIKFTKPSVEKVTETFASPATDNVDADLLAYFKGSSVGDAIEVSLKDSGLKTERSLKVRIGKHAKLANREIESRTASDGSFLFRVSAIIEQPNNGTANGQTSTEPATEPATEETSGRNRR